MSVLFLVQGEYTCKKKKNSTVIGMFKYYLAQRFSNSGISRTEPGYQTELSPAHTFFGWEVWSGITPLRRNYLRTDIAVPIKLLGRSLYDDGQMINCNVFNKHGCRWRAEMYRFESILEDIDSTFILKEEQRNAIKAFVDRKDVF